MMQKKKKCEVLWYNKKEEIHSINRDIFKMKKRFNLILYAIFEGIVWGFKKQIVVRNNIF